MKIAAGADHAGFALKEALVERLRAAGHEVVDLGTTSDESVDYPVFAHAVAAQVAAGEAERGLLVCGSGIGMCMAANRHPGVRAADCLTVEMADLSRRHNDANVLCLGARLLDAGRGLGRSSRRGLRPPSKAAATSAASPRSTTLRPRPSAEPAGAAGGAAAAVAERRRRRARRGRRARPSWDEYFLQLARQAATRSTCLRRQVGAVLVRDRRVLATGYNGAPRGVAHCLDMGCLRDAARHPLGRAPGALPRHPRRAERHHPGGRARRGHRRRHAVHARCSPACCAPRC